MKHAKAIVESPMDNTIATEEVSLDLVMNTNVFSPKNNIFIDRVWYHLILDVNGLLCIVVHLKSDEWWQPLVPLVRCGNKLVTLWPSCHEFLKLCYSRFDVGIWYTTTKLNIIPIVKFYNKGKIEVEYCVCMGEWKMQKDLHLLSTKPKMDISA